VYLYLPFTLGAGCGWMVKAPPGSVTPWKDTVPIIKEVGSDSRSVQKGEENLTPTGVRNPDLPLCRQSLYRHTWKNNIVKIR